MYYSSRNKGILNIFLQFFYLSSPKNSFFPPNLLPPWSIIASTYCSIVSTVAPSKATTNFQKRKIFSLKKISFILEFVDQSKSPNQTLAGEYQNCQSSLNLNGRNHLIWSRLSKYLSKKEKVGLLDWSHTKQCWSWFLTWDVEDSLIISWLWNLMIPKVTKLTYS